MERSERLRQRAEAFAAQLQEEFGVLAPDEQGCLLSVVEDFAIEIGDEVSRAVIRRQVEAGTAPVAAEEPCCPTCQRPARRKKERKRRVETRRGAIHVAEPEHYCNRCRRSFFPSDPLAGDGA